MDRRLNVGIAGYGFHGQSLHQAALSSKRINVVAVLELDTSKHKAISGASVVPYEKQEDFFRHSGLEAVIIASPVATHRELVTTAAKAGIPIELEKPMAVTYTESLQAAEVADKYAVPMMVGMTTHYRPEMQEADRIIASGELGDIRTIHEEIVIGLEPEALMGYVAEENQGGVLLENGIHLIDHLLWYGGPIKKLLSATISSRFLGGFHEDVAMLHALHEGGVESTSHLQWMPYRESNGFKMKLYGTKGYMEIRGLDGLRINRGGSVQDISCYQDTGNYIEHFAARHLPGVTNQLNDFAGFVLDKKAPLVPLQHVLEAHKWLDRAYMRARRV